MRYVYADRGGVCNVRQILTSSQLFSELDDRALDEVCSATTLKKVTSGEIIFTEGEPATAFYIVGKGRVKVLKLSSEGKEQILMIAQPGDSFAEAAMFAGGLFPASAQALEPTELVVIDRRRFVALLGRNPDLAAALIARLSELLRKITRLVEELSLSDVNTRLARYLCSHRDQTTGRLPSEITLAEKKSVLASQLGTIPETLSRAFARLTRDGLIEVEGKTVRLLNHKVLEKLAASGR
jgi:CRP/FNR family transcriptional regulator